MGVSTRVAVAIFMASLFLLSSASASDGPFPVKNLYPLFLHADQPSFEKASVENSLSCSLSHSSTHTVERSDNWTVHLDMEITEVTFRYRRILRDSFEVGLDIPVLIIGSGFMDGFLEDYHDAFGFDDYGRHKRPNNEFLYHVEKNGEVIIEGKSGTGLGDIRLALKAPIFASDTMTVSIKGDVEVPVSSAERGFSNGSVDAGASMLIDGVISEKLRTYLHFGAVFPGDVRGHETVELKNYLYGGGALAYDAGEGLSLIAQLQAQTALYPETGIQAVDREAFLILFGGRYSGSRNSIELSLTEDLSTSGSPDFIVNLTYKMIL